MQKLQRYTESVYLICHIISWKIIFQNIDEMAVRDRERALVDVLLRGCSVGAYKAQNLKRDHLDE